MSVRDSHEATEGDVRSTDWTTIGARILQMAEVASGLHLIERVRRQGKVTDVAGSDCGRRSRMAGSHPHDPA
jgi:hypothetical protein